MAQFNATGFSGFDEFFGKDDVGEKLQVTAKPPSHKGKRGGVGAILTPKNNDQYLSKRLLRVGSKRSHDDEEDEVVERDDDHEETGRTGISKDEKKSLNSKKTELLTAAGETRKLGKKERKRLKESQEKEALKKEQIVTEENDTPKIEPATKRKFKRKKIRSRQKNIRKDNRTIEEKPKHLLVGALNYQGRPLTEETRTRLSLPPPKSQSSLFVVDRSPVPVSATKGVSLGVDDFLTEPTEPKSKKQKTSSKKKKKKYKNL
jgi:hypothetical protein